MTISSINNHVEQWNNLNFPSKKQLFCSKHKIMLGIAVSLAILVSAVFYAYMSKPGCVEGFIDKWTDSICKNGEFISNYNEGFPDHSRFAKLIEECASGAQIPGCLDGKYYHHLTKECKHNPAAALCDGKYDYQDFLKEANLFLYNINKKFHGNAD